jgi:hypothetical protein
MPPPTRQNKHPSPDQPRTVAGVAAEFDSGAPSCETAAVGAMLLDERAVDVAIRHKLTAAAFSDPDCAKACAAVLKLRHAGELAADVLAVADRSGVDPAFLEKCVDSCPTAANAGYYIELTIVANSKRQVIEAASNGTAKDGLVRVFRQHSDRLAGLGADDPLDGQVRTVADVLAYRPDPADTIAGCGFLRRKAMCLLTGGTGLGKSVLVTQAASSVADGKPILGVIPVARPFTVLLAQAENDIETMQRDLAACVDHLGSDVDALNERLHIRRPAHRGDGFLQWLDTETGRMRPDLIIVDNYQSFVGAVDINGTGPCLAFLAGVQRIIDRHNAGLLLVAHTPKPRDRDSWNVRENVYMAAGTSALANWARTSCELMPAAKEVDRFRLTFSKNAERNGMQLDHHPGVVRELYLRHSGDPARPFWFVADDQTAPSRSEYADRVRQVLRRKPDATLADIMAETGCSKSTASRLRSEAS